MLGLFKSDKTNPPDDTKPGWTARLKTGLVKTRAQFGNQITRLFTSGGTIDQAFYDELETILLSADVGLAATEFLLADLKVRVQRESLIESAAVFEALKRSLITLLAPLEAPLRTEGHTPFVIMIAGVNGSGKTTTIGKLAKYFQTQGKSVLLAAGDTFRAAAREQLAV